jgi:formate hydrogenlyase subunit 3/multisubunit Na+/H+ antiporter MnhD subunit
MSRPRYTGFCDSCFLSGRAGRWWGVVIMVFGILSAVLGAAYAFVEKN